MAGKAKKTEHAGAKRGRGTYWGCKADAKRESNKVRLGLADLDGQSAGLTT